MEHQGPLATAELTILWMLNWLAVPSNFLLGLTILYTALRVIDLVWSWFRKSKS